MRERLEGSHLERFGVSFGLTGMRERVQALHGRLGLEASPDGGAMVTALLPLPRPAPEANAPLRAVSHLNTGDRP